MKIRVDLPKERGVLVSFNVVFDSSDKIFRALVNFCGITCGDGLNFILRTADNFFGVRIVLLLQNFFGDFEPVSVDVAFESCDEDFYFVVAFAFAVQ